MSRNLRVLFVEDHAKVATHLTRRLVEHGCTVTTVGTLTEARRAVEDAEVDVALLDLELPDGRGEELLPAIRKQPANPAIVILSGHVDAETAVALSRDCEMVIPKPAPFDTVLKAIDEVTGDTRLRRLVHGFCARGGLTPREEDCVWSAVLGRTKDEAVDRLGIAPATLRTHWHNILRKTQRASQRDVVAAAMRFTFRLD